MPELNHVLHYEDLPSAPPEKRPKATKAFQDFKVLALSTYVAQGIARARRRYMRIRTATSKRSLTKEI